MDLKNELRGKMSRLCGGDGCVEWVSVAGEKEWYSKHKGRLNDDPTTTTTLKGVITASMGVAPIDDIKSWLVDKLVAKKISKENAIDACNKLISQDITSAAIFTSCDESDMTKDFLKQIGISSLGVRTAILDIYKNERSMLGHNSDDNSSADKKSYADAETMKKLQAKIEMMEKKLPIHDDKIKSTNYNVSVNVGNGQQQLKQNQKEQHLNSPNHQMNDDAAELAQRVKHLEKELYVNQEAFNRDIHQEVEKINEDRSPSRVQQQQTTMNANNAVQCCTVS